MKFQRIRADLDALEGREHILSEEVLHCFFDLCEDIRCATGSPVDKAPVNSPDRLFARLPWAARLLLRLYDQSKEELHNPDRRAKLDQLAQQLTQAEEQVRQSQEELLQLQERQTQLEAKRTALQRHEATAQQLRSACEALEAQFKTLSEDQLAPLQARQDALRQACQQAEEQCRQTSDALTQLAQKREDSLAAVRRLDQEIQTTQQAYAASLKKQDQLQGILADFRKQLEFQTEQEKQLNQSVAQVQARYLSLSEEVLPKLTESKRQLEAQVQTAQGEQSRLKSALDQLKAQQTDAGQQIQTLQEEISSYQAGTTRLTAQNQQLEAVHTDFLAQLKAQQTREAQLRQDITAAQKTYLQLSEETLPQLEQQLTDTNARSAAAQETAAQLRETLETLDRDIQQLAAQAQELEQQAQLAAAQKAEQSRLWAQKNQQLETLQQAVRERDDQCAQLQGQIDHLTQELSTREPGRLKTALENTVQQKQALLDSLRDLELRLQEEQSALEQLRQKHDSAVKQQQDQLWQQEQVRDAAQQEVARLQAEQEAVEQKCTQLQTQRETLARQREALAARLSALQLEENAPRMRLLRDQVRLMREAESALEADYPFLRQSPSDAQQHAGERQTLRKELEEVEQRIGAYLDHYSRVVRALSSRGD